MKPSAGAQHAALEVQLGDMQGGLRLLHVRLGDGDAASGAADIFQGHDLVEAPAPFRFFLALVQRFFGCGKLGVCLGFSQFETLRIDAVQHIAAFDALVILDGDLQDGAGHFRRDAHNIRADPAIAGPGGDDISLPKRDHQR